MTSGNFHSIPVAAITIDRDMRQRRDIEVDDLAASISSIGLINPIVITPDKRLIAGERRLTAVTSLGWTHIPCQYTDELQEDELHLIELEENIRREDLTWQEECQAVQRYHDLRAGIEEDWSAAKTADALHVSPQYVSHRMEVAREIAAGNKDVIKADKYSVAKNLVSRKNERKASAALNALDSVLEPERAASAPAPSHPFEHDSFIEWTQLYTGMNFNLIHCDFPYGIGADAQKQGVNVELRGSYEDTPEVYDELLDGLADCMDSIVAPSAHLIFWFSVDRYQYTYDRLNDMGWTVNPFPLVWHKSDNTGLLPDPNRGPRRTYETAFFAARGDRKIVRAVANSYACPAVKGADKIHMSEKPTDMLEHFMRMVCDESTRLLDPTCGSGSALRAARTHNPRYMLGLEIDEEFYNLAKEKWNDA